VSGADVRAVAIERLEDLLRIARDPATDEATARQAATDAQVLAAGLDKLDASLDPGRALRLRAKWIALIRAHRATGKPRPSLIEVAEGMGWASEQPLRDYCRELGVKDWHDVHPIVAAARV